MRKITRNFQENLSTICDELRLAKQWGKSIIILTTHKSIYSQNKLRKALQKKLLELDYNVIDINVNNIKGNFIEQLANHEQVANTVFCISKLDWGSGTDRKDGYRLLNLYRETLIERNIKAVFLLTKREASNLPHYAPDFWAFRHRVLEFFSPRPPNEHYPPVSLMLWHVERSINNSEDLSKRIINREKTLLELPRQDESISLRLELQLELGFLYWYAGETDKAEFFLRDGLNLARKYEFSDILIKYQNGLSILFYEKGDYESSIELLEATKIDHPQDCILRFNQAIVMFAIGKRYQAIQIGKKVASLCNQNPWILNGVGFLYFFAGKLDEAAYFYQMAIRHSPKNGYFSETLALCYWTMGLYDEANAILDQNKDKLDSRSALRQILNLYIHGETKKASALIEKFIRNGKLRKLDIKRDTIMSIINSPNEFV